MDNKPLGKTGLDVSAIGLGSGNYGREIDEEASYRVLDYAHEKGITFFDSSNGYGGGNARQSRVAAYGIDDKRETTDEMSSAERIIGSWMKSRGCRDEITICTKFIAGPGPESIGAALSEALGRLQTDYVDVYMPHVPRVDEPVDETLHALSEEVAAGRVKVLGCSNHSADQVREALKVSAERGYPGYGVIENAYNLLMRGPEDDLFHLARAKDLGVTPFSPIGAGFLTGKYSPDRSQIAFGSRFHITPGHADEYLTPRNFEVLGRLQEKAGSLDMPVHRLAMAWAMTSPDVTAVIVGARNPEQIDNAIAAYEMGMDAELRAELSGWTDGDGS